MPVTEMTPDERARYPDGVGVAPAGEQWDDVALVERPSFDAFRTLVESDVCRKEAEPHRAVALAGWRLIATSKADLPR